MNSLKKAFLLNKIVHDIYKVLKPAEVVGFRTSYFKVTLPLTLVQLRFIGSGRFFNKKFLKATFRTFQVSFSLVNFASFLLRIPPYRIEYRRPHRQSEFHL